MIIQAADSEKHVFPQYVDKLLFIIGLSIYVIGQMLLNRGQDFVSAQQPVDFAHWMLLIGAVFLLPFAGRLPRRNIHLIVMPLLIAGITFIIGMCVLDFIFWSLPPGQLEDDIVRHLINTPVIWEPFISFGPNWIFGFGLGLPALSYLKTSRIGVALVAIASILMANFGREVIVYGYLMIIAGYVLCFDMLRPERR